ncbi:MAG: YHS domain-containing (seleno)protein [Devosiaceae bacterium]
MVLIAYKHLARAAVAAFFSAALLLPSGVTGSERIVSNPDFQLALFGYDPVAYFADGEAREGTAEYEVLHENLAWRFASAGNLEAFLAEPSLFLPAFGGHGALFVARGTATPGHPEIWVSLGGRVFFFKNVASRYAFLLEAERMIVDADANWALLRETLAP